MAKKYEGKTKVEFTSEDWNNFPKEKQSLPQTIPVEDYPLNGFNLKIE